jgi:alkaline phosphatase D
MSGPIPLLWGVIGLSLVFVHANLHLPGPEVQHRIAFGSCYNPNKGDAIWNLISSFSPNQLILLGDQIYADFHPIYKYKYFNGSGPDMIDLEYQKFRSQKGFQDLAASLSHKWISVYDDHDYGINNGDKTYPYRQEAIHLFAKHNPEHFVSDVSLPDQTTGKLTVERKSGVFSSHLFQFPLRSSGKMFSYKVVLLDIRSNKDPKDTEGGDFLGEQQWRWLTYELSEDQVRGLDLIIVGSGTQMLSDDKLVEESWGEFPAQRERLLELLVPTAVRTNLLLLSGDIHCAEISQAVCSMRWESAEERSVSLVELTSSGLSHTFGKIMDYEEMKRQNTESSKIIMQSRSYVAEFYSFLYNLVYPALYREDKNGHVYQGLHFGLVDIAEVSPTQLVAVFHIVDHEGRPVMAKEIPLRSEPAAIPQTWAGRVSCRPIRGDLTPLRLVLFKANLAFFSLVFVVLPLFAVLWLVGASLYYVCVGRELRRREEVERNYQLYKDRLGKRD